MKRYLLFLILAVLLVAILTLPKILFKPSYGIKVCDMMNYEELKITCYAMFSKNYNYCLLTGSFNPFCIDFVSSSLPLNESFCNGLDGYKRISCTIALAVKEKNPNFCESLGSSDVNSCYYQLASYLDYLNINEEFCEKVGEESLKFICLAKIKRNATLCENIVQEPFEKPNCLAVAFRDMSYCQRSNNFNYCILLVALETKNPELCKIIESEGNRIECMLMLRKDIKCCDEFEQKWKEYCILNFLALKNLRIL